MASHRYCQIIYVLNGDLGTVLEEGLSNALYILY